LDDDDDPRAAEQQVIQVVKINGPRSGKKVGNRRSLNGLLASNSCPDELLIFSGNAGCMERLRKMELML
jgi:hypothetical protein